MEERKRMEREYNSNVLLYKWIMELWVNEGTRRLPLLVLMPSAARILTDGMMVWGASAPNICCGILMHAICSLRTQRRYGWAITHRKGILVHASHTLSNILVI